MFRRNADDMPELVPTTDDEDDIDDYDNDDDQELAPKAKGKGKAVAKPKGKGKGKATADDEIEEETPPKRKRGAKAAPKDNDPVEEEAAKPKPKPKPRRKAAKSQAVVDDSEVEEVAPPAKKTAAKTGKAAKAAPKPASAKTSKGKGRSQQDAVNRADDTLDEGMLIDPPVGTGTGASSPVPSLTPSASEHVSDHSPDYRMWGPNPFAVQPVDAMSASFTHLDVRRLGRLQEEIVLPDSGGRGMAMLTRVVEAAKETRANAQSSQGGAGGMVTDLSRFQDMTLDQGKSHILCWL